MLMMMMFINDVYELFCRQKLANSLISFQGNPFQLQNDLFLGEAATTADPDDITPQVRREGH